MTKEEIDRIKKAYSSGLKVQIWFNGYWEDFDIRDYSMYPEPFSENRQYRIVGSDYADIAEKQITELEEQNTNLQEMLKTERSVTCKEEYLKKVAELEKENAELKEKNKWYSEQICNKECAEVWGNLTKAKEIILKLYNAGRDVLMCRVEEKAYDNLSEAINDKSIEQFLQEIK